MREWRGKWASWGGFRRRTWNNSDAIARGGSRSVSPQRGPQRRSRSPRRPGQRIPSPKRPSSSRSGPARRPPREAGWGRRRDQLRTWAPAAVWGGQRTVTLTPAKRGFPSRSPPDRRHLGPRRSPRRPAPWRRQQDELAQAQERHQVRLEDWFLGVHLLLSWDDSKTVSAEDMEKFLSQFLEKDAWNKHRIKPRPTADIFLRGILRTLWDIDRLLRLVNPLEELRRVTAKSPLVLSILRVMAYEFMWMPSASVRMAQQSAAELTDRCNLTVKTDRQFIAASIGRLRQAFEKAHQAWEKKVRAREEKKQAEQAAGSAIPAARPKGSTPTAQAAPKRRAVVPTAATAEEDQTDAKLVPSPKVKLAARGATPEGPKEAATSDGAAPGSEEAVPPPKEAPKGPTAVAAEENGEADGDVDDEDEDEEEEEEEDDEEDEEDDEDEEDEQDEAAQVVQAAEPVDDDMDDEDEEEEEEEDEDAGENSVDPAAPANTASNGPDVNDAEDNTGNQDGKPPKAAEKETAAEEVEVADDQKQHEAKDPGTKVEPDGHGVEVEKKEEQAQDLKSDSGKDREEEQDNQDEPKVHGPEPKPEADEVCDSAPVMLGPEPAPKEGPEPAPVGGEGQDAALGDGEKAETITVDVDDD